MAKLSVYKPTIGEGVYTVPDASHILKFPQTKLRRWVTGYWRTIQEARKERVVPVVDAGIWGEGRERAFNFYTLIELYTIMALRNIGVSFKKIRHAREELARRFKTKYPFAAHQLMSDGKQILVEFKEGDLQALLELDTHGQMAIEQIIKPFCKKLEFNAQIDLVELYRPLGEKTSIIVNPHHGFGRPTIEGTNITTEAIYNLIIAGEDRQTIEKLYDLASSNIDEVIKFEKQAA
jgi:uncharacterized protein (DUF433 family)/DNA-binding transcriptional MerR regulator